MAGQRGKGPWREGTPISSPLSISFPSFFAPTEFTLESLLLSPSDLFLD